jgi:hypothetical protein
MKRIGSSVSIRGWCLLKLPQEFKLSGLQASWWNRKDLNLHLGIIEGTIFNALM